MKFLRFLYLWLAALMAAGSVFGSVHEYNGDPSVILVVTVYTESTVSYVDGPSDFATWLSDYWLYYRDALDIYDDEGQDDFHSWTNWSSTWGIEEVPNPDYETWESVDEPDEWIWTDWDHVCSDFWEDQTGSRTRNGWRWHYTYQRSNLGNICDEGGYWESTSETESLTGCRPLNWQYFDETVADWHEVSGGPDCSLEWEDRTYTYNYSEERTRRVGWRNDRDGVVDSEEVTDSRTGSRTEQGCKPLNWQSFEDVTDDWHEVSGGPDCSTVWEGESYTYEYVEERNRRTGERNDRGEERNVQTATDSRSGSRAEQGCKPLHWENFDEVVEGWRPVGDWTPSTDTEWEDRMLDQTRASVQVHRAGERNERGDEQNVHLYNEEGTDTRRVPGTRPLNWHSWQNRLLRDWYDVGTWGPAATTRYFWEDVSQGLTRQQDWEEWQINDRGETRWLRFFTVIGTLTRTVKGTKVPDVGAIELQMAGGVRINAGGGSVTLSNGIEISGTIGGPGGSISIPPSVVPGGVTISKTGDTVTVTDASGSSIIANGATVDLGGGVTVGVSGTGEATLTVSGGPSVTVGANGAHIGLPNGAGIGIASDGKIDITLPPGTPSVLAKAVNTAGIVYNAATGHIISLRNAITLIIGPLPSNPFLDVLDIAVGLGGIMQLGLRQGSDGPFMWLPICVHCLPPPRIAVDANRDGLITFDSEDAISQNVPFKYWLNDDFDSLNGIPASMPNYKSMSVDGWHDLKDFFPVFLDIQQLVNAQPPSASVRYFIRQSDGALNFIYTDLSRENAFLYRYGSSTGCGPLLNEPADLATTLQITPAGVELSSQFLENIKTGNKGVLLVEARAASSAPLVLAVEKDGVTIAEAILPLSVGPRILLLLHGMNSNTATWDKFVVNVFGTSVQRCIDIRNGDFDPASVSPPDLSSGGVRCYRLQFGSLETAATARAGLEELRASTAQGGINGVNRDYLTEPALKCGDFETFEELAQEIDDAIQVLLDRHPNAEIVLLGHSRGGLAARKFLQGSSPRRSAVIGFLSTSSPHQGSPLGRFYDWLDEPAHRRGAVGSFSDDWDVVEFLRQPEVWHFKDKTTLDVRRPVIHDLSDRSAAIAALNDATEVSNLPKKIVYGEIINSKINLGVLTLGEPFSYGVFDDTTWDFGDQVSAAAETAILGVGKTPANFPGDGLVPGSHQVFTQLPGFPSPGFPPSSSPATGQNTIPRLLVHDRDLVHSDAPSQYEDIRSRLRLLVPGWFP